MSAAALLHAKIVAIAGVGANVSPDIRRGSNDTLPCVIYGVESDDLISCNAPSTRFYQATCTAVCIASTAVAALATARLIIAGMHGQTWTTGTSTAHRCRVVTSDLGVVEDSDPATSDNNRTCTVRLALLHSFT